MRDGRTWQTLLSDDNNKNDENDKELAQTVNKFVLTQFKQIACHLYNKIVE